MDETVVTGWWTCSDCGVEAELPAEQTAGFLVTCPDCDGVLVELWSWEVAPAPRSVPLRHAA